MLSAQFAGFCCTVNCAEVFAVFAEAKGCLGRFCARSERFGSSARSASGFES